jgi:hypothetical protein
VAEAEAEAEAENSPQKITELKGRRQKLKHETRNPAAKKIEAEVEVEQSSTAKVK